MRKIVRAVAVAAALAFAGTAQAQFALDLKVGYAIPTGNSVSGAAISDSFSGALPLEVAGRYRFTPNLSAGLYFGWNPAFVKSGVCDPGTSCSGSDMRLGLEVMYGFNPTGMNPWISLGTGWEWLKASQSGGATTVSATLNGWEYFNLQAGVDFPLSKLFALGPYVGYSGGTYSGRSITLNGTTDSGSIDSSIRAFHGWFQFGAKGTFNF
jgi:hypothetical protein